jgi:hypothetical protein
MLSGVKCNLNSSLPTDTAACRLIQTFFFKISAKIWKISDFGGLRWRPLITWENSASQAETPIHPTVKHSSFHISQSRLHAATTIFSNRLSAKETENGKKKQIRLPPAQTVDVNGPAMLPWNGPEVLWLLLSSILSLIVQERSKNIGRVHKANENTAAAAKPWQQ